VTPPPPTDFSKPEFGVDCLADGVRAQIDMTDGDFEGLMYVRGHSNDERCRRAIDRNDAGDTIAFKVTFGTCGLFHSGVRSCSPSFF